jgi:hypothetical protein
MSAVLRPLTGATVHLHLHRSQTRDGLGWQIVTDDWWLVGRQVDGIP